VIVKDLVVEGSGSGSGSGHVGKCRCGLHGQ
jgi:hypothetical protein